jgi:hypothetical protein
MALTRIARAPGRTSRYAAAPGTPILQSPGEDYPFDSALENPQMNNRTNSRRILRSLVVLVAVGGLLTLALGSALAKTSNADARRDTVHSGPALVLNFPAKVAPAEDSLDKSVDETDTEGVDENDQGDDAQGDENDQGDQVDEGDQGENEDAQGDDQNDQGDQADNNEVEQPEADDSGDSGGDD